MKNYLLVISSACPTTAGRRAHRAAVADLREMGLHKIAPNTFRGAAKSAAAFEKQCRPIIPPGADWRLFEIASCDVFCGADFERRPSLTQA